MIDAVMQAPRTAFSHFCSLTYSSNSFLPLIHSSKQHHQPCVCHNAGASTPASRFYSSSAAYRPTQQRLGTNQQAAPRPSLLAQQLGAAPGLLHDLSSLSRREFSAAQAEPSADDVVAQVLSCAATNNTETGVLSQVVSRVLCIVRVSSCLSYKCC